MQLREANSISTNHPPTPSPTGVVKAPPSPRTAIHSNSYWTSNSLPCILA